MSIRASDENFSSQTRCHSLLKTIKQTAEWILSSCASNVWNTYGSLPRFCSLIDDVLMHGLRQNGPEKYWFFVQASSRLKVGSTASDPPEEEVNGSDKRSCVKAFLWLEKSLVEHNLSVQLQELIGDVHHLSNCYEETAFLRNKACIAALLTCLRAIEQNQPMLLTDLDPALVLSPLNMRRSLKYSVNSDEHAARITVDGAESTRGTQSSHSSFAHLRMREKSNFVDNSTDHVVRSEVREEGNDLLKTMTYDSGQTKRLKRYVCRTAKYSQRMLEANRRQGKPVKAVNFSGHLVNVKKKIPPRKDSCYPIDPSTVLAVQGSGTDDGAVSQSVDKSAASSGMIRSASCPQFGDSLCVELLQSVGSFPRLKTSTFTSPAIKNDNLCLINRSCDNLWDTCHPSAVCDKSLVVNEAASHLGVQLKLCSSEAHCDVVSDNATEKVPWKAQHNRSSSDGTAISHYSAPDSAVNTSSDGPLHSSLPTVFSEPEQLKKKSIFEGDAVLVPTECFFPRPQPGQTLTSFLSSDFNIHAELDRENAHFCISEALISAIEQVKCTNTLKIVEEEAESDEEIKRLTQRIRIRRSEKIQEKVFKSAPLLSDGKTDTTTSHSASPMSSHSSDFGTAESIGSDEDCIEDLVLSDNTKSNLSSIRESGLSLSMASLYSDADIHKGIANSLPVPSDCDRKFGLDINNIHLSAEAVALSLLTRFSEKQLPKASDLEWLVSEQDAPQQLLPLPDSWPVSPDEIDDGYDFKKTRLRGNSEWAPPRRQIIFIVHPYPKRKDALLKQNYRCAGCGMKIELGYAKKFRYCDYLGKFFCQCCHANDLTYIPGRILWKWDFRKYYVSKFAYKLLDQMYCDPLFSVFDINSVLYRKVRQLDLCQEYRIQLFYLRDFIRTCRNTEQLEKELKCWPEHLLCEPHLYSINDFLQVKDGKLPKSLRNLVNKCLTHVMKCILCQGRGFICEMCNNERDVIFPFQIIRVCHCHVCGSCFHKKCRKSGSCPKCDRIKERKKLLQDQSAAMDSEEDDL